VKQKEFEGFLADKTKRIDGNIHWRNSSKGHAPAVEFRMEVISQTKYPILVRGWYNPAIPTLSYVLIHLNNRIYALDMGKEHPNPSGVIMGKKHKHRWSERFRDKEAYIPPDITASIDDPIGVWQQFCKEAGITHNGVMLPPPPPFQGEIL
jgi:hypothetical protein